MAERRNAGRLSLPEMRIEKGERQGLQKGERKAAIPIRQQTVQATRDIDRLDQWLDRLVVASSLDELEIPAAN